MKFLDIPVYLGGYCHDSGITSDQISLVAKIMAVESLYGESDNHDKELFNYKRINTFNKTIDEFIDDINSHRLECDKCNILFEDYFKDYKTRFELSYNKINKL